MPRQAAPRHDHVHMRVVREGGNFGAKDGVPRTTILYPIDFLPAR